jgi:protein-S-isoprenylcysteine O-methyltransferase Ste14
MDVRAMSARERALYNLAFALGLLVLPAAVWYTTIAIQHYGGHLVWPDTAFLAHIQAPTPLTVGLYVGWFALQMGFAALLPGKRVYGQPLPDGRRLPYRLNGLLSHVLTLALAVGLVATEVLPATLFYDHLDALISTANLLVFALSGYMLWLGRRQATEAERERNLLEAYFVGAALSPRNGGFDWKFVCESRPGMILWVLIDFSLMAAQYRAHGSVSNSMWLVCAMQLLYVSDYFVVEDAVLTTWDIRHEPFGFMLCWGCLVWVPFTFSLQALYLVQHPVDLPLAAAVGIVALNMLGYAIFRASNLQKHQFRSDPSTRIWGREARYIQTEYGTKLLTSGWWGVSRHSNYLGDLTMGLAWCLTTGFNAILPYFYFIYFVILLVHRERRLNKHCARKYGKDWEQYESQVRWRILPFVY